MATKIEREFAFQAAVHFEGNFLMTVYELSLGMEVDTASIKEQNIAMDRITYFLSECLENSVFVEHADKKAIDKYLQADIKVCTLPEEPYDQIITILLLLKLNAITEGKFNITHMSFKSQLSDDVEYLIDIEDVFAPYDNKNSWWNDSGSNISDNKKTNKKDKIVKLHKDNEWAEIDLGWKHSCKPETTEIIFTLDTVK